MEFNTIKLEMRNSVCWVRLTREQQMNSLNQELVVELQQVIQTVATDSSCRVLILTGTGPAFCAGADLKSVLSDLKSPGESRGDFLDEVTGLFFNLRHLDKPVICGLNGLTMAGGLELAMCCDLIIAGESAKIGDAHSNFALFPGAGGATVLPQRIGLANARYLLYSGNSLPASRLQTMGLVQEVVADHLLDERLEALANQLVAKSPLVLKRMKQVSAASLEMSQEDALQLELKTLREHLQSEDAQEGLRAFQEKRKPKFSGR